MSSDLKEVKEGAKEIPMDSVVQVEERAYVLVPFG